MMKRTSFIVVSSIRYTIGHMSGFLFVVILLWFLKKLLLLLLSRFSHVRLCVTPQTAAHQAPPSLGFSRQEHWSGLSFPSPMHKSEKWKWSRSVVSDSQRPHGLQPTRLLRPWHFPGKSTGVGCHCLLRRKCLKLAKRLTLKKMYCNHWEVVEYPGLSLTFSHLSFLAAQNLSFKV